MEKETKLPGTEELDDLQVDGELTDEDKKLFGDMYDDKEEEAPAEEQPPKTKEPDSEEKSVDEDDPEPEDNDDPTKDWTLEDYKNGYKNLQKVVGKQGLELGELRKIVTSPVNAKKEHSIDDIPEMDEATLSGYIEKYEAALADPALEFEDQEKFNTIKREYAILIEERAVRKAMSRIEQKTAKEKLSGIKAQIAKKYTLTDEELTAVTNKATKLSDNGIPSETEFEAAVYSVNPQKFSLSKTNEINSRIMTAKTKETPRIPSGSNQVIEKKITAKELAAMGQYERDEYLDSLSIEEVEALSKEIIE